MALLQRIICPVVMIYKQCALEKVQLRFASATGIVSRPDRFVIAVVQTLRDSDANNACMRVRGSGQAGLREGGLGCVSCAGTIIQGLATWPSTQPCPLNNSIKWTPATVATCITRGPSVNAGQDNRPVVTASCPLIYQMWSPSMQGSAPQPNAGVICSCH